LTQIVLCGVFGVVSGAYIWKILWKPVIDVVFDKPKPVEGVSVSVLDEKDK